MRTGEGWVFNLRNAATDVRDAWGRTWCGLQLLLGLGFIREHLVRRRVRRDLEMAAALRANGLDVQAEHIERAALLVLVRH